MEYSAKNLAYLNHQFKGIPPSDIIGWALDLGQKAVLTTNFRPYEAVILHAVTEVDPGIKVIWCDTGYNTPQTYRHAEYLIARLQLNLSLYVPSKTKAHRDVTMGIPDIDDERHAAFTEEVKLEPFRRAMQECQPKIWFTNLRKGQTAHRDSLDILSYSSDGILKVSPFYHYSDAELDAYLKMHDLPNETKYFDPTKVLANRECGLHQ